MESVEQLPPYLEKFLTSVLTVEFLWQVALVVVAIGIGFYINRRYKVYIYARLGVAESRQIRLGRLAARGSERIVFPLFVFLLVGFVKSIAEVYKIPTPLLDIVIPLSLSLAIVRVSIYILRRSFAPSPAIRAWEGVISLVVWSVVALYLLGWLTPVQAALDQVAFKIGSARFSLLSIIKLGLVLAIFVTAANWVSRQLETMTSKSTQMSSGMRVGLIKFTKVVLYTVAILVSLDSVGIDLTTLAVFGGALGVGLGFGLQRIASNFISGFILLFDRSIKPGDVISIGTRFGWVQELHARYIVVRDRDGVETLIPNENLITSEVINWSYSDRLVRMKSPDQLRERPTSGDANIGRSGQGKFASTFGSRTASTNHRIWRQWHRARVAHLVYRSGAGYDQPEIRYLPGDLEAIQGKRYHHTLSPARCAYRFATRRC